jgi:hypothetical protein
MARQDRATQERMGRGFEILWKQVSALARHDNILRVVTV